MRAWPKAKSTGSRPAGTARTYTRRNFPGPIPAFGSFEALNAHLLDCRRKRRDDRLRGHGETIGERLERDLAAFTKPLPPAYDACEKLGTTASSLSLVRYRLNDYSVPTTDVAPDDAGHILQILVAHPRSAKPISGAEVC